MLIGLSAHAQYASQDNRFEQSNAEAPIQSQVESSNKGPGNVGENSAPISDYVPILMLVGIFLIVVIQRKKTNIN